jgi:hypothetical protein
MSTPAHAAPLRAGVAVSDITTRRKGAIIDDPLLAKALVLDDGRTRAAILAIDALAVGGIGDIRDDFLPKLRRRVERELGIPGPNLLVNASHTHPPGRLLCSDAQQVQRAFDALRRAARALTPVSVGVGAAREDRLTINRTLRLKAGSHWTIRHANPCPPEDDVAGLGPIDPEIGLLRFDRPDGSTLAVLWNFACHPLFGNPRGAITANYPGVASRLIEETLGGGATALFLQGAGGDIVDIHFKDFTRPRDVRPMGTALALAALKALRRIRTGPARISVRSETILLPRRTDIPRRIAALEREQAALLDSLSTTTLNFKAFLPLFLRRQLDPARPADYAHRYLQAAPTGSEDLSAMDALTGRHVEKYLGSIRAMERLARIRERITTFRFHQALNDAARSRTIPAEVMGLRIGDCALITCPAEALAQIGLNVKKRSPHKHTFMSAFTNGYVHYGAPADYYDKGGYEVTECFLAPQWQRRYERAAARVLARL